MEVNYEEMHTRRESGQVVALHLDVTLNAGKASRVS